MTQNTELSKETKQIDSAKPKERREKNFQSKVIIRRLPPTMTEEQFLDQVSPLPDNDYVHFVKADLSLGVHAFSRAYINFLHQDDIILIKDKFDGYVFVDTKGMEYPALVEFAPFQKIPKKRSKKKDTKCGTLDQDPDYIKFVELLKNPVEEVVVPEPPKEPTDDPKGLNKTTPLIEFLKQKKMEKQKIRDEKREERKKRDLERKRVREEERRRRKSEKGSDSASETASSSTQPAGNGQESLEVLKKLEKDTEHHKTSVHLSGKTSSYKTKEGHHGSTSKDYKEYGKPYRDKERMGSGSSTSSTTGTRRDWERSRQREKVAAQRERDRARKEDTKSNIKSDRSPLEQVKGFAAAGIGKESSKVGGTSRSAVGTVFAEDPAVVAAALETNKEPKPSSMHGGKEPRKERQRIRNKDRPSLEIYRPGMRRLSGAPSGGSSRDSPQKDNSPSPCNSPPLTATSQNNNSEDERPE